MFDPLSLLAGATLVDAGWLTGRHARLKAAPKPILPICLCEHAYGFHDPKTGACKEGTVVKLYSSARGQYQETLRCDCRRYTGPQPVEQYWVAPTADLHIATAPRLPDDDRG